MFNARPSKIQPQKGAGSGSISGQLAFGTKPASLEQIETQEASGYAQNTEDIPMTLQVGMVGTDGIVLASDEKTLFVDDIQTGGLTGKFSFDDMRLIAFSGYEISRNVAQRILEDKTIRDTGAQYREVENLARQIYQEPFTDLVTPVRRDSELLIIERNNHDVFYSLEMSPPKKFTLTTRKDKAVAGHKANSAVFFVERYYRRSPVAELVTLAGHTILQGHQLNPAGIEGLEIFVCNESCFHRQPQNVIAAISATSENLADTISGSVRVPASILA